MKTIQLTGQTMLKPEVQWTLIYTATGEPVQEGDIVRGRDNEPVTVSSGIGAPPHKPSSTGKIWVKVSGCQFSQEYYPSVFGAKWEQVKWTR